MANFSIRWEIRHFALLEVAHSRVWDRNKNRLGLQHFCGRSNTKTEPKPGSWGFWVFRAKGLKNRKMANFSIRWEIRHFASLALLEVAHSRVGGGNKNRLGNWQFAILHCARQRYNICGLRTKMMKFEDFALVAGLFYQQRWYRTHFQNLIKNSVFQFYLNCSDYFHLESTHWRIALSLTPNFSSNTFSVQWNGVTSVHSTLKPLSRVPLSQRQ